jgi:hypothetical protein
MQKIIILCLLLAPFPQGANSEILINEVQWNPLLSESTAEFVELWNSGTDTLDLEGYQLGDSLDWDPLQSSGMGFFLPPRGWALVLDPAYTNEYEDLLPDSCLILFNGDGAFGHGGWSNSRVVSISLFNENEDLVDRLHSDPTIEPGLSFERFRDQDFCQECFRSSLVMGGTPGSRNSRRLENYALECKERTPEGLWLEAAGEEGFEGELLWRVGISPVISERTQTLYLEPGGLILVQWPPCVLPGLNPCQLVSVPLGFGRRVLLDSVLCSDRLPTLYLDEVKTDGEEFLECANASTSPLLLSGLALRLSSREIQLAGTLQASGRFLIGDLLANCSDVMHIKKALALSRHSFLDLVYGGKSYPLASWRMPYEFNHAQCIDPRRDPEDASSWDFRSAESPGCPPNFPTHQKTGGLAISSNCLFPHRVGQHLLRIHSESSDMLEVWSLQGELLLEIPFHQGLCTWDGKGKSGSLLPTAMYLLRSSKGEMQSVALVW